LYNVIAEDTIISRPIPDSNLHKGHHLISIYTGYSLHISRDEVTSYFNYKGHHFPLDVDYKYFRGKNEYAVSLFYNNIRLSSDIPDVTSSLLHYTDNIYVSFDFLYNRKLSVFPAGKAQYYIGGKVKSMINYREHYYATDKSGFNFEQTNSLNLDISITREIFSKKDLLYFNVNAPLLTYSLYNNVYNEKAYLNVIIDINNSDSRLHLLTQN
jgi:hypothetical protein